MDYTMNICTKLVLQLRLAGIEPGDVLTFFDSQIRQMVTFKPNYGPHKNSKMRSYNFDTWILKGFYPGTPVLFKCCLVVDTSKSLSESEYYAKIQQPPIRLNRESTQIFSRIKARVIEDYAGKVAETELLTSLEKPKFDLGFKLNSPKCISPKGMQVFSLKKKDK